MQESFEEKKKSLFGALESAERNLQGTSLGQSNQDYNSINSGQRKRNRDDRRNEGKNEYLEKYRHRDSIFKRPALPINKVLRCRQRPDYELNPQKYKHYTLDDVTDTSDRMNTSAAFSFLRELEDRKHRNSDMNCDEEASGSQKIVFKKSIKLRPKEIKDDPQLDSKKIQSSKVVMPEYVVGEKKVKQKKKVDKERASGDKLKLSHLDEEEEDF